MHAFYKVGLALSVSALLFAQPKPERLVFEVASVKPTGPLAPGELKIGYHVDGALVTFNSFSMKDYIRLAYKVKDYQIQGPDWMGSERYEVTAKMPKGAGRDQVPELMQALIEERFQLTSHREKKDFPVYGLVVAKTGSKLKASPLDEDTGTQPGGKGAANVTAQGDRNGISVDLGRGSFFTFANNKFEGKKMTMTNMADMMARFVDRPVVDMTNMTGTFDFSLPLTEQEYRTMQIRAAISAGVSLPPEALRMLEGQSDAGDSLLSALNSVGLKLEHRKAPLDVIVIDHVLKVPTDN